MMFFLRQRPVAAWQNCFDPSGWRFGGQVSTYYFTWVKLLSTHSIRAMKWSNFIIQTGREKEKNFHSPFTSTSTEAVSGALIARLDTLHSYLAPRSPLPRVTCSLLIPVPTPFELGSVVKAPETNIQIHI
jgi:hypothetical protein